MLRKFLPAAAMAALAPAATADASLLLDFQLSGGANSVVIDDGSAVTVDVIVTISGSNGSDSDEGLSSLGMDALSSGGPLGSLSYMNVSPFAAVGFSNNGTQVDLDSDTDLDVDDALAAAGLGVIVDGTTFKVGELTFNPTDAMPTGTTFLTPVLNGGTTLWRQDGAPTATSFGGTAGVGSGVSITYSSTPVPEPTSILAGAIGLGGLALRRRRA